MVAVEMRMKMREINRCIYFRSQQPHVQRCSLPVVSTFRTRCTPESVAGEVYAPSYRGFMLEMGRCSPDEGTQCSYTAGECVC